MPITRRVRLLFSILCVLVALLAVSSVASEAPTLSETQRWHLTALVHRLEIAQLKAQLAQRDFDTAKAELIAASQAVAVEGYELDLASMRYQRKPAAAETTEPVR